MLWYWHAKPKALEIINTYNIDTVVTTGPPQSTHFIGLKLKKENPNLRWIVDFRDPWTKSFINDFLERTPKTIIRDKRNEQKVLNTADEIILVSKGMKDDFSIPLKSFHTIYNGYDENDFINIKNTHRPTKFSFNYIGTFKDNQFFHSVWQAIDELTKEITGFADDLEINFAGIVNPLFKEQITKYSFSNKIKYIGYISHHQAIEYMTSASLLFFPIPQTEYNHNIITGKIFEYLASGTPILAIGPPNGIAAQILAECQRNAMLNYTDTKAIKEQIKSEYTNWKNNGNHKVNNNLHQKYSRKNQTKLLAEILKKK
jgi:glycosyltransferase involved in cell wall biosynthesis